MATSTAPSLSEYSSRFASYNGLTASAAAAARSAETAYFGSATAAANSFGPYAAAYAAQNMMNWNSYSLATYQGLQREGVTYGKLYTYLPSLYFITFLQVRSNMRLNNPHIEYFKKKKLY